MVGGAELADPLLRLVDEEARLHIWEMLGPVARMIFFYSSCTLVVDKLILKDIFNKVY